MEQHHLFEWAFLRSKEAHIPLFDTEPEAIAIIAAVVAQFGARQICPAFGVPLRNDDIANAFCFLPDFLEFQAESWRF